MLTVVIWWCLCCYFLIIYCNKLYISFCFWWWNRNEKQKYNTDINICTNKSGPFIHETEHARYMQSSTVSVRKNWLLVKKFTWILNWLLTFKTGTWRFFWLLLFVSQSSPNCCKSNYYTTTTDTNLYSVFIFGRKEKWPGKTGDRLFQSVMINLLLLPKETIWKKWWFVVLQLFCHNIHLIHHSMIW
jgi:hypothetical protein